MRATLGRVAVVLLLSLSMCGCKSGSNMFASWGKKKPASTLSEAPAYKPTNPVLPSAGQTPASLASTASGSSLAAAANASPGAATATTTGSAVPAGYQQSPYPTTPFSTSKVGTSSGATATTAATASPSTTAPAAASASKQPYTGYASAVGTGNALPPAPAYRPGATATASSSQPQNGFYNPAYGGTGSTSTPPAYAAAAAANPAYNFSASPPSGAVAGSTPSASSAPQTSEIRVADVRGATNIPPAAQVAMAGTAPPATVVNNSASTAGAGSVTLVGDRYSNFASSGAAPTASAQPVVSAPVATAAAAPAQASNNDYYRPPATTSQAAGSYSAPEAASSSAAPASNSAPTESPLRKDPGYRPGGTSDYAPAGNVLRPSSSGGEGGSTQGGTQSNSKPSRGVVPASYQAAMSNPSPNTPAVATAGAAMVGDRYSGNQTAASTAEPAYGASSPATSPQGAYSDHSW